MSKSNGLWVSEWQGHLLSCSGQLKSIQNVAQLRWQYLCICICIFNTMLFKKNAEIKTRLYWMQLGVIVFRMDRFNNIVPWWGGEGTTNTKLLNCFQLFAIREEIAIIFKNISTESFWPESLWSIRVSIIWQAFL